MLIPFQVDVPMYRWPFANFAIIAITVFYSLGGLGNPDFVLRAMLDGSSPAGLVTYMLVHGDFMHLLGNMVFLWVFGNAVCAKVGNGPYVLLYIAAGVVGGFVHMLFSGAPTIGASGAINGVFGMYLMLYPLNNVSCFYLIFPMPPLCGTFSLSGMWIILLWVVFDIWGVAAGGGSVAYWAHLGGFAAGFGACILLLRLEWIRMTATECSLADVFHGRTPS